MPQPSTTISVVVTDIVGSTALAERLGPDKTDALRRAHFAALRSAVTQTDGDEVKNLGDGLMVVYPSARDALDGAIAMQRAVDAASRQGSDPIAIRVGVASGDAFVEDGDYFGIPVVEAARLCNAARGGQILVTALTRLLTDRTAHTLQSVGTLELKGLAEPVEAFEVVWDVSIVGHEIPMPARVARPLRYGFVGRADERARLAGLWDEAAQGDRRVALLFGEPGIGKTTLVGEVARNAGAQGAMVLYGRCDQDLGRPYQPFMEAFEHLVGHAPSALLTDHLARHRGGLLDHVAATKLRLSAAVDPAERDADSERDALFAASVDLLASASAYAPIVLVLDDLHWADRPTLLLLRHLVTSDVAMRVLVLATAREGEVDGSPLAEIGPTLHREPGVHRLSLRALDESDTRHLLELAAGQDIGLAGDELSEVVHRESGGNPFFVVELLRHLAETGGVERDEGGRWVATGGDLDLPDNVRDVVAHRVERLGEDPARVLTAASVLGRDVELAVAEALVDDDPDAVLDVFEAAGRALLVHDAPGRPGWVTFSHAIVQHTLYDRLSAARRLRLHRRAAEALARRDPDGRVAERAHHWSIAAAGGDPDDQRAAAEAARAAGDEADERLAPDAACHWYGRALELRGSGSDRPTAELLIALGNAQRQAGDPEFRDTLLRAARLARELGQPDLLVAAALANNRGIQSGTGTFDAERVEVLRWALDAVGEDRAARARLLALLALEQLYQASYEERLALVNEAVDLARQADEATLLRVLNLTHNAVKSPRTLDQRMQTTAEALDLSARLGDPADRFWAVDQRIRALGETGGFAEADALLDEAEGIGRMLARPVMLYMVSMHRTWRAIVAGDLDKAERWAEATHAVGTESGQPEADAMFGSNLLRIRREQGRGVELVELLESVAAANTGIPALRAALAALLALTGSADRAAELVREQREAGFDTIHHDNLWSTALGEWGEAAALVGDVEAAQHLLELLEPLRGTVVHNGATTSGPVDRIVGVLLASVGRRDEAIAAFEASEQQCRECGMPIYLAHSLAAHADLLADAGDPAAAELAQEARRLADASGAGLSGGHAARVLERVGSVTPSRKTKVAVLGGGAGAMAAAFELLRTPERRAALDVTVYQMGWRLGGKGASGRNHERGERIEEHGLHLWFGFYDNAFRVLGDAYEAAGRPHGHPLATLWQAFEPCHEVVIYDHYAGGWSNQVFDIPTDDVRPGQGAPTVLPGEVVHQAVQHVHERWKVVAGLRGIAVELAEKAFSEALAHAERRRGTHDLFHDELDELIADCLKVGRAIVWHHVKDDLDHAPSRHVFQLVDIVTSAWCGIVADRVFERGFSVIDHLDFLAWLHHHGASEVTVGTGDATGSGILRGFYDLVFAFADGNTNKPDLAAGRALQAALKIAFDFKGSIMWRMKAGMGDVVFGPFHEAITKLAGPDSVRYFHRVTGLRLDPTGTSVAAIDLVQQATPGPKGYHPMRDVKRLPSWPNQPYWDELVDGDRLRDEKVDLERPCPVPGEVPLTLEVGRDFDVVVLAIPTPAHEDICSELIDANADYAAMVASHRAVATQAFQVWSTEEEPDLGWAFPKRGVASGFVEPLDTLCPMPQLLEREDWPAGSVKSIWYACGVLPDVGPWRCAEPNRADRAHRSALAWLEQHSPVPWPKASGHAGFDWSVLSDPDHSQSGPRRFDSQYWRANVTPSELYIRTPPGSVTKRLWPGGSGFTNLALAGDWTRNYIDGGCVEAAVLSGLLAARFVLEHADVPDAEVRIDGEGTWLLEDGG